tara:strand:+ start:488 stop:931 length:444 start_codon:yes stop_codon:yes gene_type:complete
MAVDYKGQPITDQTAFTTTGIMNRKPALVKPVKIPAVKKPEPKVVQKNLPDERIPQIDLKNLRDVDKRILNIHLTPSLKNVFNRIFGQDMFPEFGISENTVSIPTSIVVDRFGSLDNFKNLMKTNEQTNNVPPSQGIMTSPQTSKTV